MYFLNDKHEKFEYGLYTQVENATPYIIKYSYCDVYKGIMARIEEIEKKHNRYNQRFFIDNDFYDNKYSIESGRNFLQIFKATYCRLGRI